MSRRTRRHTLASPLITIAAGAAGAVLLAAGSAAAHVRVIGEVIPGKPASLQFRVPSELADATTVRIAVAVPPGLKVTAVPALDGWKERTVAGSGGRGTRLVWTAEQGHEIKPAESRIFKVRVGPVPDLYSLTFDTEQTYSDGTIAAWNQKQTGSKEPEFPAPVLVVNPDASPSPRSAADTPQPTAEKAEKAEKTQKAEEAAEEGASLGLPAAIGIGAGTAAIAAVIAVRVRRRGSGGESHS